MTLTATISTPWISGVPTARRAGLADPIIGVGSAATPDTGPDLDNAHGQAETDTEQEIALFTVTNPPRTVFGIDADGRPD